MIRFYLGAKTPCISADEARLRLEYAFEVLRDVEGVAAIKRISGRDSGEDVPLLRIQSRYSSHSSSGCISLNVMVSRFAGMLGMPAYGIESGGLFRVEGADGQAIVFLGKRRLTIELPQEGYFDPELSLWASWS